MAQNITLLGASYADVPAVELPKTGGGTASFTDITDTTAAAADVAQGKYFYDSAGVRTEGTASGGGDTVGEYLTNTLTQYENENITTVPMTYAFSGCTSLTSLKMPNLTSSNAYLVNGCSGLTILVFPKLATFSGWQIFAGATNLHTIDILGPSAFRQQVFSGDSKLNTLILRRQTLITMANINTFNNTCFASGKSGGTLYVPSALVSSYQSASNWSTILGYANNQIKSIESTHTDPTAPIDLTLYYADGTPIS